VRANGIEARKGGCLALLLLAVSSCASYEYEEEVFLEVDGSGEIRMSGSAPAIEALHGLVEATPESAKALFRGEGVEVLSSTTTERDRRPFVHVEARFADWEKLCRVPAFRERGCRLEKGEGELALELFLPAPPVAAPENLDSQALLALRYHFPGSIRYHNAPSDIERGNILSWKRTLGEHFAGRPLAIEARFDRRTVLAATLSIVGFSLVLVAASIAAALFLMVRKGRRQLRADAIGAYPSRPGHPSGG
jgi:hypothetical protein